MPNSMHLLHVSTMITYANSMLLLHVFGIITQSYCYTPTSCICMPYLAYTWVATDTNTHMPLFCLVITYTCHVRSHLAIVSHLCLCFGDSQANCAYP